MNMKRATLVLSLLAGGLGMFGCDSKPSSPAAPSPSPISTPTPTPTPSPQYIATPVPFNLTQSRTLDILGWDSWPSAPAPSAIQFRWNAAVDKYEVVAPGYADWSRLEAVQDLQFNGTPYHYDVFGSGGTKLPFYMLVFAPPHRFPADGYVGNARIFEGRTCLLRLRNSDDTGRRSRPPNDDLPLRIGRDRRWRAVLRSCGRNRVRLGIAVLGVCPL